MNKLILAAAGFLVFASCGYCRQVIAEERRRRGKSEHREAVANWENEGGAVKPHAPPGVQAGVLPAGAEARASVGVRG